jgi:hypothetical protein
VYKNFFAPAMGRLKQLANRANCGLGQIRASLERDAKFLRKFSRFLMLINACRSGAYPETAQKFRGSVSNKNHLTLQGKFIKFLT